MQLTNPLMTFVQLVSVISNANLQGIRVLSCVSVVVFHISLLFASAVSAWGWYDAWDQHAWIAVSSAGHAIFSLHFFMMMTGILAAAYLVPKLTIKTEHGFQEVWAYYQRRLKRIVPAYYVTVGLITLIRAWPAGNPSTAAARMQMNYTMGPRMPPLIIPLQVIAVGFGLNHTCQDGNFWWVIRPLWRRLTFSSNVRLDLNGFFFEEFTWNIPIQMQFYLLFPLVILALRGPLSKQSSAELSRKTLRRRLATACVLGIIASALYKAAVVIYRDVPDPLPMLAYLDGIPGSGGHSIKDVHAAFDWLNWLHSAFLARCTDFSLGTLIYLITSSEKATQALRARPWVCNGVTAVCSALGFVACFPRAVAPISLRPSDNVHGPLAQSLIVVVGIQGLLVPIFAAWLLLYVLVQPGGVSRYVASFLGSPRWDWLAARSYSVFLLHTLVTLILFKLLPVTWLIGPLEELHTYLVICGLVLGISTVLSWLLDSLIAAAMSSRSKAGGMASKKGA